MRLSRLTAIGPLAADARPPRPDWVPAGVTRRLDPLARLALAAIDALTPGPLQLPPESAVVLHTAWGSLTSTERFLASVAEAGDDQASPTPFTTSVHNAAAGTVGELLALHGPCTTLSDGGAIAALQWARRMLVAGRAPAVLVLVGEAPTALARTVAAAVRGAAPSAAAGMSAALVEAGDGPGRHLRPGTPAAATVIADDPATGDIDAARALGGWWPGCTLAALSRHSEPGPVLLVEDGDRRLALGPRV